MRIIPTIAVLILLFATAGRTEAQMRLEKAVIATGGGTTQSQTMRMSYTIGQPVIGMADNGTTQGMFGFWNSALVNTPSGIQYQDGAGTIATVQITPNPVVSDAQIEVELTRGGNLEIGLYGLNGQLLEQLISAERPAGKTVIPFDAGRFPSGSYFITISVPGAMLQTTLTIVR